MSPALFSELQAEFEKEASPADPVRLWSADPSQSRRASWLERFFDLIFVAAVAQVGVSLGEDDTLHGLVRYGLMFLLIWWAWLGHTMYFTRRR